MFWCSVSFARQYKYLSVLSIDSWKNSQTSQCLEKDPAIGIRINTVNQMPTDTCISFGVYKVTMYAITAVTLWIQYWSLLNWRNLRFRFGSVAVAVNWLFVFKSSFLRCLRTLYIVWSPVRRRVTRRLTRFQTMCNFLNPFSTETVLLVGYWSPITYTLL